MAKKSKVTLVSGCPSENLKSLKTKHAQLFYDVREESVIEGEGENKVKRVLVREVWCNTEHFHEHGGSQVIYCTDVPRAKMNEMLKRFLCISLFESDSRLHKNTLFKFKVPSSLTGLDEECFLNLVDHHALDGEAFPSSLDCKQVTLFVGGTGRRKKFTKDPKGADGSPPRRVPNQAGKKGKAAARGAAAAARAAAACSARKRNSTSSSSTSSSSFKKRRTQASAQALERPAALDDSVVGQHRHQFPQQQPQQQLGQMHHFQHPPGQAHVPMSSVMMPQWAYPLAQQQQGAMPQQMVQVHQPHLFPQQAFPMHQPLQPSNLLVQQQHQQQQHQQQLQQQQQQHQHQHQHHHQHPVQTQPMIPADGADCTGQQAVSTTGGTMGAVGSVGGAVQPVPQQQVLPLPDQQPQQQEEYSAAAASEGAAAAAAADAAEDAAETAAAEAAGQTVAPPAAAATPVPEAAGQEAAGQVEATRADAAGAAPQAAGQVEATLAAAPAAAPAPQGASAAAAAAAPERAAADADETLSQSEAAPFAASAAAGPHQQLRQQQQPFQTRAGDAQGATQPHDAVNKYSSDTRHFQMSWQHSPFAAHFDDAGCVMLKDTNKKDSFMLTKGFGNEILTVQLQGEPVWIYMSAPPEKETDEPVVIRFKLNSNDAYMLAGTAREGGVVHGVLPTDSFPSGPHTKRCRCCRVALTIRLGIMGSKKNEEMRQKAGYYSQEPVV